jgi:hypothetical protein
MFKDLLPQWEKSNWVDAWAIVGEIRELCEKNFGEEDELWQFIGLTGACAPGLYRLPYGIRFFDDVDATRFRLVL